MTTTTTAAQAVTEPRHPSGPQTTREKVQQAREQALLTISLSMHFHPSRADLLGPDSQAQRSQGP